WWSAVNLFIVIFPLILFLAIQYVPLFATGFIPFVGPGGMFVSFVINLFHVIGVLFLVIPLSTWFFEQTGKIYLGAWVSALLVVWMFLSSQVIRARSSRLSRCNRNDGGSLAYQSGI
ncbi:MAG: hypothetical protein JRJ83_11960, partial [Deltaproteobacteria bacterium]|nr:hypothetical protein [Deltaproteobacteria bacterium]